ncbi:hypothetical protein EV175_004819 [Coemansia sp. RSA 1933]|nr:hypothetical protein EV175_004819 [Coemansia sp. RSA 1933]
MTHFYALLALAAGGTLVQLSNADNTSFEVSQAPAETPVVKATKVYVDVFQRRLMRMDDPGRIPPVAACAFVGALALLVVSWLVYACYFKKSVNRIYEVSKQEEEAI